MFLFAKRVCVVSMAMVLFAMLIGIIITASQSTVIDTEPMYITVVQEYTWEPEPWEPVIKPKAPIAEVKIEAIQESRRAMAPRVAQDTVCFDPMDVTKPANLTEEQLRSFVDAYCPAFTDAISELLECDKQLNVVFILAVSRCETDGGNPEALMGAYNIFNIRNSDGSYCDYESYASSLEHFMNLLTKEYVHADGCYYEGLSIEAIGTHYAVAEWAPFVTSVGEEILQFVEDS